MSVHRSSSYFHCSVKTRGRVISNDFRQVAEVKRLIFMFLSSARSVSFHRASSKIHAFIGIENFNILYCPFISDELVLRGRSCLMKMAHSSLNPYSMPLMSSMAFITRATMGGTRRVVITKVQNQLCGACSRHASMSQNNQVCITY